MVQRKPTERAQDRDRIQFTDAPDQVHTIEPIWDSDSGDGSSSDAQCEGSSDHVNSTNSIPQALCEFPNEKPAVGGVWQGRVSSENAGPKSKVWGSVGSFGSAHSISSRDPGSSRGSRGSFGSIIRLGDQWNSWCSSSNGTHGEVDVDDYPPLEEQIARFVKTTGGGQGAFFEDDSQHIFALGVTKQVTREGDKASIFVPKGFAEGRDLPHHLSRTDAAWSEFVSPARFGSVAFGRVNWDPKTDPALYVRISQELLNRDVGPDAGEDEEGNADGERGKGTGAEEDVNDQHFRLIQRRQNWALPHLLTVFAERVWGPAQA